MKKLALLRPIVVLAFIWAGFLIFQKPETITIQEEIVAQQEPTDIPAKVVKYIGMHVVPRLKDDFVKKYRYEDSAWFCVALKVNGQYFNVFRNNNNGVSNDKKRGLTGCIPMNQISRWWDSESPDYRNGSRIIYFDTKYPVAQPANTYGYTYQTWTLEDMLELEYSPVKEKVEYLDLYLSPITNEM